VTFRLKQETEDDKTMESGKEFQILTIQLVKEFVSFSVAMVLLANLSELPRVKF
jgi:hypothetical protein